MPRLPARFRAEIVTVQLSDIHSCGLVPNLGALMQEAELVFKLTDRHSDGTRRYNPDDIGDYMGQVMKLRKELDNL
jgi:hypothetical protein